MYRKNISEFYKPLINKNNLTNLKSFKINGFINRHNK